LSFESLWADQSAIGRDPDTGGYTRGGWTPTEREATHWFLDQCAARNLTVDHARRAVHRDAASLDGADRADADTSLHDRIASVAPAADSVVADRQTKARIDDAIAALPAEQREVFLMREVMEMPFAEIATAVGASEPTVKSRMRYALEKLRAALVELGADLPGAAESSGSR